MAETHDPILKGGIVVDQAGAGARDIGVGAGRIAAIGDLQRSSAARQPTAAAFTFCRA